MPKTKISEFSATPANNTDIDSINIAEGCAPSGINDAIRELMAQLKDFQTGAVGDSFNGPVGTSTAAAGAFTTLSASSTVSGTGFSTYLASPPAIGGTAAAAVSATTLSASGAVTLSGGTANGVAYLNGSKVVTSGSALTFDGTNFAVGGTSSARLDVAGWIRANASTSSPSTGAGVEIGYPTSTPWFGATAQGLIQAYDRTGSAYLPMGFSGSNFAFAISGSEGMRLTSTGLGIGTSSPRAKVDVSGSVLVGTYQTSTNYAPLSVKTASTITTPSTFTNAINIWNGTTVGEYSNITFGYNTLGMTNAAAYMGFVSTSASSVGKGDLVFGTRDAATDSAATERLRIDSFGNLGLGVTPSAWGTLTGLQVKNASVSGYNNEAHYSGNAYYGSSSWRYISNGFAARYSQNDVAGGAHAWFTAPTGTAGDAITFTQAMTLNASGQLAIGTTSIDEMVRINGSSNATARIRIQNQTTDIAFLGSALGISGSGNANDLMLSSASTNNLVFGTNTVERARIDSSGNLLVGTTSAATGSVGAGFQVQNNLGTGSTINIGHPDGAGSGFSYALFSYNNSIIGSIGQSGTTGVLYNITSDQRLKENIQDADSASSLVDSLQVRKFDWKTDQTHQRYGFIAQELITVAPEAVYQPIDPDEMMAVDYSKLVPMLVKEIQSLRKRLADAGI